eukprot:c19470_g1_i1 orf=414-1751(-)
MAFAAAACLQTGIAALADRAFVTCRISSSVLNNPDAGQHFFCSSLLYRHSFSALGSRCHPSWLRKSANDGNGSSSCSGSSYPRRIRDEVCDCAASGTVVIGDGLGSKNGEPLNTQFPAQSVQGSAGRALADQLRLGGLDRLGHSYSEKFVIRCYEVGMNRTASIETIANLLQEAACNHVQSVGFSTDGFATTPSMKRLRLIWVTTRMHIEVDEYPAWGDVVKIETWCQCEGKVGTRRDWLLTNAASGKIIGRATSMWVMMNQDTRRLARITDDIRSEYMIYCPDPPRWSFPKESNRSLKKIPELEDPAQFIKSYLMARRGDLDMNQHVNNVTYIGWILESMTQKIIETHQLYRITLDYRRECKDDDVVESIASLESLHEMYGYENCSATSSITAAVNGRGVLPSPNTTVNGMEFLHMLRLAGSGIEISRGRTEWKRKPERHFNVS